MKPEDPKILKSVVKKKPATDPVNSRVDKPHGSFAAEPKAHGTTSRATAHGSFAAEPKAHGVADKSPATQQRRYGTTSRATAHASTPRDSGHKARTTAPHSQSYDACVALVGKPVKIKLRGTAKATAYPKLLVVHTYQLVAQTTDGKERIINKHAIDYIEPIEDYIEPIENGVIDEPSTSK